ncbi:hypothetical protein D3C72_1522350 [compost metagenome]
MQERAGVAQAASGLDGPACGLDAVADVLLAGGEVIAVAGVGECRGEPDQRVVCGHDLGAWPVVAGRRDQCQASQAREHAAAQEVEPALQGLHGELRPGRRLQARGHQHDIEQLGRQRTGRAARLCQTCGKPSCHHDQYGQPGRRRDGRAQRAGYRPANADRSQAG